ncbi:MAG: SusC/RagA family TonB-linked outer membrane protein [Microscillaceae bacterium]|nr:SusC/RagA family TonB-linked outer membrane protein [Microscillaceae bacterium]
MTKKLLLITILCFTALGGVLAQNRTLNGRVTDQDTGQGLPGVNVFIKGTTTGTVTDVDGNYSIQVSEGAVLVFQAVGLTTLEQTVGAQSSLDIQMTPDTTELGEVVVTGYGLQDKRSLTGSIASVKGESIQNVPLQSFDKAVQGRIAGVLVNSVSGQPGSSVNFQVRGVGSINAGTEPLYIIDGVQVAAANVGTQGNSNGSLAGLNPNDIESIEVLKDAASAAVYGAQAANGVVLITTKKGKGGKTIIEFTAQEGWVQPMNLYDVMNGVEFATIRREAYTNRGLPASTPEGLYGNPDNPESITNFDWVDEMFRDARLSTYDLSVSGGTDKTTFYLSGSYTHQEGQLIKSEWKRGAVRLNVSHKATERFRISSDLSANVQDQFGAIENGNFVNGPFQSAFVSQPSSRARNPETGAYNPYPENGESHNFRYNIKQGVEEEIRKGLTIGIIANLKGTYQIIPQLSATSFVGVEFIDNEDDNQRPSTIPAFAGTGGSVFKNARRFVNFNTYQTLNYQQKFSEKHIVSGLLGFEFKSEKIETFNATGQRFSNPAFRYLDQAAVNQDVNGNFTEYARMGVFGQAKYEYDNRYFVDFTLRTDGHSRFGSQSRWGTFYAGSVAWRITSESFMENISFIDDLKLRVSYGVVGNSDLNGNYRQAAVFASVGAAQYQGVSGLQQRELGNDAVTWEEERQIGIGLDFALVKNRLYGSIDYWNYRTSKMLFDRVLPQDAGFFDVNNNSVVVDNIVEMDNKGVDIELGAVVLDIAGFKWNSVFNISFLDNEIVSLPGGVDTFFVDPLTPLIVGMPRDLLWMYSYAGVSPANGRALIFDADGNYSYVGTPADRRVVGDQIADYYGGWLNTFSYKGFTFEIFFQYQYGNKVFLGDLYNLAASGSDADNQLRTQLARWQNPGDITNVPIPWQGGNIEGQDQQFGDAGSTRYVSDGGYIRLKQIRASYEFPSKWMSKIGLRRANIFAQGLNLATITNFVGIDPEVVGALNQNGTSTFGNYPNARQYTLGVTIGF